MHARWEGAGLAQWAMFSTGMHHSRPQVKSLPDCTLAWVHAQKNSTAYMSNYSSFNMYRARSQPLHSPACLRSGVRPTRSRTHAVSPKVSDTVHMPDALASQIRSANQELIQEALSKPLIHSSTNTKIFVATSCCWAPYQWCVHFVTRRWTDGGLQQLLQRLTVLRETAGRWCVLS